MGIGDIMKFWVEITGLKNRISESLELDLCAGYVIYRFCDAEFKKCCFPLKR